MHKYNRSIAQIINKILIVITDCIRNNDTRTGETIVWFKRLDHIDILI